MKKYVVVEKRVGETPLQCLERWRASQSAEYATVPITYEGRLDPMASGKLLLLIGEECKQQTTYRGLDKAYRFSVLFGVCSDTGDVLGLATPHKPTSLKEATLSRTAKSYRGALTLPYPSYSSKTVAGKPLHTWALEGRLGEIEIPMNNSAIHHLSLTSLAEHSTEDIHHAVTSKIASLPAVTEDTKRLGQDFRRADVLKTWEDFKLNYRGATWQVAEFYCVASSGTYMRSLAEALANAHHTQGLAFSIHREAMGSLATTFLGTPVWWKRY